MKAWLVIGIILLVLFLLSLLSVKVKVRFQKEEFFVSVGILCFRFQLIPQKEKPQEKTAASGEQADSKGVQTRKAVGRTASQTKKAGAVPDKPSQTTEASSDNKPVSEKRDLKETVTFVLDVIHSVLRPTKFMLRHMQITDVQLHVVVGGTEPDETGIRFGRWNAAVYSGLAALRNFMRIKCKKIMLAVDFTQPETTVEASGTVKVRVFVLLISAVRMVVGILAHTLKRNQENADAAAAVSSS